MYDMAGEHVPAAVDAESEQHNTLFAMGLRLARVALELLQVPYKPGFPGGLNARGATLHACRGSRGRWLWFFDLIGRFLLRRCDVGGRHVGRRRLLDLRLI